MSNLIYPRSPREIMAGWAHLPRFVDKVRLHLAGHLHPEYQGNFTKGFDGWWLEASGVNAEEFIEVVKASITDGQVCDWVMKNVRKTAEEKAAFNSRLFTHGTQNDEALRARLKMRKDEAGLGHRDDIRCFVDFIDADEKRLP